MIKIVNKEQNHSLEVTRNTYESIFKRLGYVEVKNLENPKAKAPVEDIGANAEEEVVLEEKNKTKGKKQK